MVFGNYLSVAYLSLVPAFYGGVPIFPTFLSKLHSTMDAAHTQAHSATSSKNLYQSPLSHYGPKAFLSPTILPDPDFRPPICLYIPVLPRLPSFPLFALPAFIELTVYRLIHSITINARQA